jgi:hypothetical protein
MNAREFVVLTGAKFARKLSSMTVARRAACIAVIVQIAVGSESRHLPTED